MKVLTRVMRKTEYATIVEMSEEHFKALRTGLESTDRPVRRLAEKEVNKLIDVRDWQDDDLDSIEEFEPYIE